MRVSKSSNLITSIVTEMKGRRVRPSIFQSDVAALHPWIVERRERSWSAGKFASEKRWGGTQPDAAERSASSAKSISLIALPISVRAQSPVNNASAQSESLRQFPYGQHETDTVLRVPASITKALDQPGKRLVHG